MKTHAAPEAEWMTSGVGHPRRWPILAVLVVSLLVVVLDNTVLNIALPTIQQDLKATPSELVWAVDSYILTFAALLFTWGVLGDRLGRKRVLIFGLVLFAAASVVCAFSVDPGMLIGFRALMGVGGAAVLPTTLAIITVVFPPHERGKAIGLWAGAVGAAVALGPVLGGLLLQHPDWFRWLTGNDWGAVFLINAPIVVVGLIAILRVVPETKNPAPKRLDVTGLLVSITGLTLLIYGIIDASRTRDWLAPTVIGPIIAGIAIIGLFLWIEARSDHGSFDVGLFRNRGYAVSLVAVSLAFFALSGITFTLPFYLQILRGFDPLTAGLCFVPFAAGQLIAAPQSAAMVAKLGYRAVMTTGLLLVALSLIGLTLISLDSPIWMLLVGFFIFGLGMGSVIAPASTVMQNVLPLARAGAGSAVQNTVRQVGGALGVAIIGTLLATQYSALATPILAQLGLSDEVVATAAESIIATDAVLNSLPAAISAQAQSQVFTVFLDASHMTYFVSLAIVLIAAVIVGFGLPHITPPKAHRPIPADSSVDELIAHEVQVYPTELAEEMNDSDAQPETEPPVSRQ
ncbi:MAG: MFS transporter [Candidatus Nanopelagicales bacterium]|jgi:MFS transporter, DHA2 family, multidrug resistance protein|nr:MFS transporter [Candidatus Nanopelagicales bacterium]MDP4888264.1 MFS transporter [Candidatus Nanopelagicales bacterium]